MDISNNHILIQDWMVSKLNLSGNNLLLYALIYGVSQDNQSKFTGSLKYICKRLNCSKPTAIKSLKFLIEKDFIKKESKSVNRVVFNEYSTINNPDNIDNKENLSNNTNI